MADKQTPPARQHEKRPYPRSPLTHTPSKVPTKKLRDSTVERGKKDTEISLSDIYERINTMKVDIEDRIIEHRRALEEKMSSLEEQIREKISNLMEKMKQQVQEEVKKAKEQIEQDINANFQFLEDDMRSKMATIDKTNQHLNSLEQYTRKNSIRLFGIKESDEDNVERQAIQIIKDNLRIEIKETDIEIAHRAGKFRPEGRRDAKKSRPVLLKFASHKTKVKIMRAKKEFKGTEYWVTEDLTSENADKVKVLNQLRKDNKIKSVWTVDGKIRVKKLNDTIVMITTKDEIQQLERGQL